MENTENSEQQPNEIELLKGLIGMLRDAADAEVERNESGSVWSGQLRTPRGRTPLSANISASNDRTDSPAADDTDGLSTAESSIVLIRNVAIQLYSAVDSSFNARGSGSAADNWGQVVDVVSRIVGVLCPVLSLLSVAEVFCRYDSTCHDVLVREYQNTVRDDDFQIGQLKNHTKKISELITNMWKDIDNVLRRSRWLPAEVDRIDHLLKEIKAEIEMARIHIKMSQAWLEKLEKVIRKYDKQMTRKNVLVWIGVLAVSGGLYYCDRIDLTIAAVLAAAGGIPLCHSYFSLSADVMRMSAEIRAKQRRNDQLEVKMKEYEVEFGKLSARRLGSRDATLVCGRPPRSVPMNIPF